VNTSLRAFEWREAVTFWRRSLLRGLRWVLLGGLWEVLGLVKSALDRANIFRDIALKIPTPTGWESWVIAGLIGVLAAFAMGAYQICRETPNLAGSMQDANVSGKQELNSQPIPPVVKLEPRRKLGGDELVIISLGSSAYDVQLAPIAGFEFDNIAELKIGEGRPLPFPSALDKTEKLIKAAYKKAGSRNTKVPFRITYYDKPHNGMRRHCVGELKVDYPRFSIQSQEIVLDPSP
jgi:hypothetical protein